jgi:D-glycero-D-manno-heptose 1,7-bisphosphate phosphatase
MKLVILDRDGVINHDSEAFIKSPQEWNPIDGSLQAIARLTQAGFSIAVATNQSGIARGLYDLTTLGAMHAKMHELVQQAGGRIDAVFFCPHDEKTNCTCRKPRPGMMIDILQRFKAVPAEVMMVGDKLGDMQAAHAAGCQTALVATGYGTKTAQRYPTELQALGTKHFADLAHAATYICETA